MLLAFTKNSLRTCITELALYCPLHWQTARIRTDEQSTSDFVLWWFYSLILSNSMVRKYNLIIAGFVDVTNAHSRRRYIASLILNLANRRKWFVNFTLQPFNPGKDPSTHWIAANFDILEEKVGIRIPDCPSRSLVAIPITLLHLKMKSTVSCNQSEIRYTLAIDNEITAQTHI